MLARFQSIRQSIGGSWCSARPGKNCVKSDDFYGVRRVFSCVNTFQSPVAQQGWMSLRCGNKDKT